MCAEYVRQLGGESPEEPDPLQAAVGDLEAMEARTGMVAKLRKRGVGKDLAGSAQPAEPPDAVPHVG